MPKNILFFLETKKNYLPIVGGKAVNLGILFNSNFNVPEGFTVTTGAYYSFLNGNKLEDKIDATVKKINYGNTKNLDSSSKKIRGLILKAKIEPSLAAEIKNAVSKINGAYFAVRSSATAEDLQHASFAGQQDTYLFVKRSKIVENVQKCWASLYTSRALFYRNENKIKGKAGIAVVVQEMIDPDFAGVMFTLDPIYKKDILVEATKGVGEKLVSGQITPNTYFIHKTALKIKNKHVTEDIDEKIILKIAEIGAKIENHYKKPQDIEFAVKNKEIFILQSRAITTL
jgi:phosphoenolpyruvate synthase/pyruvate phosphate dikinase